MTGNLAFPLLLVGGLFLLSRRGGGAGGPGGFGGGNNPMQMGKSKAKFQMEPNTGVTFDDVAGVNEAKEDFEEVRVRATEGQSGFWLSCIIVDASKHGQRMQLLGDNRSSLFTLYRP
jgi:hypothetical protein